MANNSSIQEQLTFKAILQFGLLFVCILVAIFYIFPTIQATQQTTEETNNTINQHHTVMKSGISFNKLDSAIQSLPDSESLLELIKEKNADVKLLITRTDNDEKISYIDWLNTTMIINDDEKEKVQEARSKINAIVPTISPFYESLNEDNVTLGDYIAFVEQNILKRFNITSFSSLGIAGIQYLKDDENANNIGKFQVELNFTNSTVSNVLQLLDYIHNSGNYDKVSNTSRNTIMKDPLMTIESFSITESADSRFGDATVSGRLVINFYIRGSSEMDKKFLVDTLEKRKKELQNNIANRLAECERNSCPEEEKEKINQLNKKFTDFSRSLSQSLTEKSGNTTEVIYIISQQLQSISSLDEELSKIK